ncbi:MAG: hypothetical protein GEV06_18330 [Luteitalea sp.]|nr:hypothetical protein [Luteitalea sp.]
MKRILIGTCILAASAFAVAAGTTQSASAAASQVALQEPAEPPQQPEPPAEPEPAPPTEPAPEQPPTEPAPPTDPGAPAEAGPAPEAALGGTTIKGCLEKGEEEGTFKLTKVVSSEGGEADADAAEDVTLKAAEGVDMSSLADHIGSTVEVSGSWADEPEGGESAVAEAGAVGGGKTFTPASAQLVSDSCEGN